jgi:putative acetyltransferase
VRIVEASAADLEDVLSVERQAFGEVDVAELVRDLVDDPSAQPLLSLLAWDGGRPVGHVMFTAARLEGSPRDVSVSILAPLAVVPDAQRGGIGGRLIEHGVLRLRESGVELMLEGSPRDVSVSILAPLAVVRDAQRGGIGGRLIEHGVLRLRESGVVLIFVLGHPEYYPRHGFAPASRQGLAAPYPISPENAWMVRALRPGVIECVQGTSVSAEAMNRPEHCRE